MAASLGQSRVEEQGWATAHADMVVTGGERGLKTVVLVFSDCSEIFYTCLYIHIYLYVCIYIYKRHDTVSNNIF